MNLLKWLSHLFAALKAGRKQTSALSPLPSSSGSTSPTLPKSSPQPTSASTKKLKSGKYPEKLLNTPNVSNGRTIKPQAIVLHHTAGSYQGSVAWCMNPASRVSYHCIVARDGRRTVLADPDERCWHAGVSSWRGRRDLNSWSIGAAFEGNTYERVLTVDEMASMADYLAPIMDRYGLTLADVTDHRTVSPGRKDDLNSTELARFKSYLSQRLA